MNNIDFSKHILKNGLRVIIHQDKSTPIAAVNVLYDVGSRDEDESRTGFAHLFEHLMFGGSVNAPIFDEPIEMAGGKNNAFTNTDITNYYEVIPSQNIETALWLESDRMLSLAFDPESLETQRKVVSEEFKEHYINQPYGDISHLMSKLCFTKHTYRWPTIGADLKHIEEATLADVKSFFKKHYLPNNAVLAVCSPMTAEEVLPLVEKYFADIPSGEVALRNIPVEPIQAEPKKLTVQRKVPANALYMAFHCPERTSEDFYAMDILTDLLSNGNSSRMYQKLVMENPLFIGVNCYHTGNHDPGLVKVSGKLLPGVSFETAEAAIWEELRKISEEKIEATELQKVKNKIESTFQFSNIDLGERAFSLAYYELLFGAERINTDFDFYQAVTIEDVQRVAKKIFIANNCSVLHYEAVNG
jgi:predicted Zn-dependent peptidase